jgi:UTP--glucose-1-phosphate uridylyltransferase
MPISAVITAAAPNQRHLLHQTIASPGGRLSSIAHRSVDLLLPEGREPLVDRLAIVVHPGDKALFEELASSRVTLIEQNGPRGYLQALYAARDFIASDPCLHLVGDHFYLADQGHASTLAAELIGTYRRELSTIVAVQPTRESQLQYFGAVGGVPWPNSGGQRLYQVQTVIEKPTPTEAEQKLIVSGLRAGHYLCFFGMHIFSPSLMHLLDEAFASSQTPPSLSAALHSLAQRERVLATILPGVRYDLGAGYGVLQAQLALALKGPDRESILTMILELLAR